jgi:uncharacterized membrane protein
MSLKEKLTRLLPEKPKYTPNPRDPIFWRDSFIIFWVFSFLGHLIEYPWNATASLLGQSPSYASFFTIAPPYGFGALAILWFIYPLFIKKKMGVIAAFFLSMIITTIVEFICALIPYLVYGRNVFWDYSNDFMNLFGFVCLKNSIAFGVVGVLFIYVLFPLTSQIMKKLGSNNLTKIFLVLAIGYIAVRIHALVTTGLIFS